MGLQLTTCTTYLELASPRAVVGGSVVVGNGRAVGRGDGAVGCRVRGGGFARSALGVSRCAKGTSP